MTTVKFLHSGMTGAPVLSGQAGAFIAVLDACLVNGWGSATVDSLAVASGVATVTKSGHPFVPNQITEISGAGSTGGTLNGQRRVLTTTSTTYTFDATGIPDQAATGTISHKVAALGWTKPFATAGNVAVYRMNTVSGTGSYFRADDSGTTFARCVGYLSMSDLSTGLGPFPTAAQVSGGTQWGKSSTADATARAWLLVGDDQGFYLVTSPYSALGGKVAMYFGDHLSVKPVDPYRAVMCAPTAFVSNTTSTQINELSYGSAPISNQWFARGVSGIGEAVRGYRNFVSLHIPSTGKYSGESSGVAVAFPNAADNGFYLSPMYLSEPAQYRGTLPGFYVTAQNLVTSTPLPELSQISGVDGLPGRQLLSVASAQGFWFADITGPWR